MEKKILVKVLKLEKCFRTLNDDTNSHADKKEIVDKFERTWGKDMADHFLWKYNDAESLIWAFDSKNLELFIKNF